MNSNAFRMIPAATVTLAFLAAIFSTAVSAQQDLAKELQQMSMDCRAARSECFSMCLKPARNLARGYEVSDADIEACRTGHAKLEPPAKPESWKPVYAPIPDVVGVFRGALVAAQGRDDWKRYCRSSALIGDINAPKPWNVPKGATVRVSGVRYVTNPIRSFDRRKTACIADSVEVISTP
jgi:hypothetical protein